MTQPFDLNGTSPVRLAVRQTSGPESATQLYSVIADYGWAERILCSGCFQRDANDIADLLGQQMNVRVTLAVEVRGRDAEVQS